MRLRYLTAGDSHGPALLGILDGLPAGLPLSEDMLAFDLARRQRGYGRGGRQKIERDHARILSGLYRGATSGAPLGLYIENLDWANWQDREPPVYSVPRPGHADFAGALKYGFDETRPISERASARETAMRVALGGVAKALLEAVGVQIYSRVVSIGAVEYAGRPGQTLLDAAEIEAEHGAAELSEVRCPDKSASSAMIAEIDAARKEGDSLGGTCEVFATNAPVGLGSHTQWDKRLDAQIAAALISIQSVKGVEIGSAVLAARSPGSAVQDELRLGPHETGWQRMSNRAGGIEGGMTNGLPVFARVHFKPIATLQKTLWSVDLRSGAPRRARYQRSDVCVVAPGSVVAEAVLALCLADAVLEAYGGDRLDWLVGNVALGREQHRRMAAGSGATPESEDAAFETQEEVTTGVERPDASGS